MLSRFSAFHFFHFTFVILLTIFLNSCSHTSKQDGPPRYDVDVSNIPNAVPRQEAMAKYGNYKSYIVFGKRYYTLKNSHNYNEVGTASWYGSKFHSRKTSSGERYDMLAMTAAHKTLPLPTYVEVTNLANQRRIIVKVNDRGPFESSRIIDLSYVAAKKLGMLGRGTANVRVRAINPNTNNQREPFFADSKSTFERVYPAFNPSREQTAGEQTKPLYLQVGAFRNKQYAVKLKDRVSLVSSAPVSIISPSRKQGLYKVKVGPFRDVASLTKTTNQLKSLGMNPGKI